LAEISKNNQFLVKVCYAGVNPIDFTTLQNKLGHFDRFEKMVTGSEVRDKFIIKNSLLGVRNYRSCLG